MQVLFGIIIGIFFTIGAAYMHDATINTNPLPGAAVERPMVNWDVANASWRDIKARVNAGWRKLQSIG